MIMKDKINTEKALDDLENVTNNEIPKHIAIIMDGNGRWSDKRKLPKVIGHRKGADALGKILTSAENLGVKYLTAFTFSTENWNRPQDEVQQLMNLLRDYLKQCIKEASKNITKFTYIGDITRLDDDIQENMMRLKEMTKDKTGINFVMAVNYGGRDEIVRATRSICRNIFDGKISVDDISQELFSDFLDTTQIPDPDLLIRTSGELRLSNFLLWQTAYTEFYFTNKFWPDFNEEDLLEAVKHFQKRQRRFGLRK